MVLSKRCFNARQINELAFDCIVVGSDEVWNYRDTKGNAELKFGVGLTCKNLIAYAPSVGKTAADEAIPQYVIDGIRKFKRISARDDLTEQLVEQVTGNAPKRVLDPTFLAEFPRAELKAKRKPYILFYYCENLPKNILNQIFYYAKEHGLAVYGAGECDKRYSEVTVNLTPFEWVEMFRNAEFVFTGTFHGAVFSILNRRQFKVYLTNESRIKKVTALLSELQITNRPMRFSRLWMDWHRLLSLVLISSETILWLWCLATMWTIRSNSVLLSSTRTVRPFLSRKSQNIRRATTT